MAEQREPSKARLMLKRAYWPSDPVEDADDSENDELLPAPPDGDNQADAAAYGAAVTHAINRPDEIRSRAQIAATISAAAAAALAGLGIFSGLSERADWLRGLVILAILAWLWSVRRYIQAIAWSGTRGRMAPLKNSEEDGSTPKVALDDLLKDFARYSREMRFALKRGTAATQCAIIATAISAVALTAEGILTKPPGMTALLHPEALAAAAKVCDEPIGEEITVRVRPGDLVRDVVPLELAAKTCRKTPVTLHVRRSWIRAVREAG